MRTNKKKAHKGLVKKIYTFTISEKNTQYNSKNSGPVWI